MSILADDIINSLEVLETKNLLSHEQVIARNLKRLKEAMLNLGQLVDPLIVDKKTGVVLDGNHRLKVLEIIECPFATCQPIDYMREDIKVGTWYPVVSKKPEEIFQLDDIKYEKVDFEEGKKAIDDLKAPLMLNSNGESYLINPGSYKLMEMVEEQNYVFSLLEDGTVDFVPEPEMKRILESGKSVFYRRSYTKEEIIKAAQMHNPFPPKSTRHLIPGRIIRLNMRLGWLHRSKEEASSELKRMLKARAYTGNVRKYYEPVIVIY